MMHKNIHSRLCFLLLVILLGLQTCWATAVMDFDGDGKTDPVILRTQSGHLVWYILQSRDGYTAFPFGQNNISNTTDAPVPADYDGDGKCDIAVWRRSITGPAQSYFFIYYSGSSTVGVVPLGGWQDDPMPQDYDGDGKADPAIYRQVDGTWYIQQSRDGFRAEKWGVATPIPGDYDGDGKADLAGYLRSGDRSDLIFYIMRSSDGNWIVEKFGYQQADMVVPGDYDGDGKTDIAVWRGNCEFGNGVWYWLRSSDNNTQYDQMRWGIGCTTDKAAQGDYDGDGKTDIAVFRSGNSTSPQSYFYINESTNGYTAIPWGWRDGTVERVY